MPVIWALVHVHLKVLPSVLEKKGTGALIPPQPFLLPGVRGEDKGSENPPPSLQETPTLPPIPTPPSLDFGDAAGSWSSSVPSTELLSTLPTSPSQLSWKPHLPQGSTAQLARITQKRPFSWTVPQAPSLLSN